MRGCLFLSFCFLFLFLSERKDTSHPKIVGFMHSKSVGTTEQPVHIMIVQTMVSMIDVKLKQKLLPADIHQSSIHPGLEIKDSSSPAFSSLKPRVDRIL